MAERNTCRRIVAGIIIATAAAFGFSQPLLGATPVPPAAWIPTDLSRWLQPISPALDNWSLTGDGSGSCGATRSRVTGLGPDTLTLTSSGAPCGDARTLGVTLTNGRLNLLATASATQATTSLSSDFRIALQYGITDTLKVGFQEAAGAGTNPLGLLDILSMPAMTSPADSVTPSFDAAVNQFSIEYNSGSWLARTAVLTGSLFTLQEIEIQNRIAPNWTADIIIEHTVAGDVFDAGQFAISGRIGDVSIGLNYMRGAVIDAFEPDSGVVPAFTQGPDTPSLSVGVPMWGWQWTLYAVGGPSSGLTLTAQRSSVTVTLSGEPLGVLLTQNSQF
ncbi:MAG TPA: hypothetical protein VJT33_01435 [bacterium]|nr:hypothetical protein [bacterium]